MNPKPLCPLLVCTLCTSPTVLVILVFAFRVGVTVSLGHNIGHIQKPTHNSTRRPLGGAEGTSKHYDCDAAAQWSWPVLSWCGEISNCWSSGAAEMLLAAAAESPRA